MLVLKVPNKDFFFLFHFTDRLPTPTLENSKLKCNKKELWVLFPPVTRLHSAEVCFIELHMTFASITFLIEEVFVCICMGASELWEKEKEREGARYRTHQEMRLSFPISKGRKSCCNLTSSWLSNAVGGGGSHLSESHLQAIFLAGLICCSFLPLLLLFLFVFGFLLADAACLLILLSPVQGRLIQKVACASPDTSN